jgi:hypothetical protein
MSKRRSKHVHPMRTASERRLQSPLPQTPKAIDLPQLAPANSPVKRERIKRALETIGAIISVIVSIIGIVSLIPTFLYFRQDISVEPGVSYDSHDPFDQRFAISNNGPLSIDEVHYTCAVTFLNTGHPETDKTDNQLIPVMVPIENHIAVIRWKEKTSTMCDFIARFGPDLQVVRVAIDVFYRTKWWPWERKSSYKFSARRDDSGRFLWDYGSPDRDPMDAGYNPDSSRPIVFLPFIGEDIVNADDPTLYGALATAQCDVKRITSGASFKGHSRWKVEDVLPPNMPRFWNWKFHFTEPLNCP